MIAWDLYTKELPISSKLTMGRAYYTTQDSGQIKSCSSCSDSDSDSDSGDLWEEHTKATTMEALEARVEDGIREDDHTA